MTEKEQLVVNFLNKHNGSGYYISIRDELSLQFDDEDDFDNTLRQLVRKNWIHELDPGTTLFHINPDMVRTKSFETELTEYKIKTNGADGGHRYLSAEIEYNGIKRKLTVFLLNKSDENELPLVLASR